MVTRGSCIFLVIPLEHLLSGFYAPLARIQPEKWREGEVASHRKRKKSVEIPMRCRGKGVCILGPEVLCEFRCAQFLSKNIHSWICSGVLRWLSVKNPPANAGDADSIPGMGRSPGEGSGNPLQYSCLKNPVDRGT